MWWGFVVPCKITWCRIIVLPFRRAFLYIKLATDFRSRASIHLSTQQERIRIKKMNEKTTRPKLGGCGQD